MRAQVIPAIAVLLSVGYLLWPTLRGGDLLGRDMVFVPDQPLDLQALGLGGAAARAVPLDAVVSLVQAVLGSWLTARLALVVPLVAVAYGVRRLLPRATLPATVAMMALSIVNPFVIERLAIGQWALLWAYAALPWLVHFIVRARPSLPAALLVVAAASITPTGGLIAFACGLLCALLVSLSARARIGFAVGAAVVQLPWVLAGFVGGAALASDPAGVEVFAAHADAPGGVAISLLGLGGIWNAEVVPPSRSGVLGVLAALLVAGCVVGGATWLRRRLGGPGAASERSYLALAWCSGIGVLLALLPATAPGAALTGWLVESVPGAGLLRDSQKWLLPFVVLAVLSVGAVVSRVTTVPAPTWQRAATVLGALALPMALVPDAHAVLRPTLTPVQYADEWATVAREVGPGDTTVVVPWSAYRGYEWADGRSALDPAPRILSGLVVTNDELVVGEVTVRGESQLSAEVGEALAADDPVRALSALGVDHVLIEKQTPGQAPAEVAGLPVLYDGSQLTLVAVPDPAQREIATTGQIAAVIASHVLVLLMVVLFTISQVIAGISGRRHEICERSR
ncbi:hypothetical protein GCM10027298_21620 [Epidermidibacterium keratini]